MCNSQNKVLSNFWMSRLTLGELIIRANAQWVLFASLFTLGLCGCIGFQDSPFTDQLQTGIRNHNGFAGESVYSYSQANPTQVKIALISDSHQNYGDLNAVRDRVNSSDADFVVHLGDFTNSGKNTEYDHFAKILPTFKKPMFVLPGNHDSVGFGPQLFERVFGPFNFVVRPNARLKLVLFNSNKKEFGSLDFNWLRTQTRSQNEERVIIMMHVNHDDKDQWSDADRTQFSEILEENRVRLVLNGHLHEFFAASIGSANKFQVARTEGEQYAFLIVENDVYTIQACKAGSCRDFKLPLAQQL